MSYLNKKNNFSGLYTAFALAVSVVCMNASAKPVHTGNDFMDYPSAHGVPLAKADPSERAHRIIRFIAAKLEGSGYVANDYGMGPSKFGITRDGNRMPDGRKLTDAQIAAMDLKTAEKIYKAGYWNQIDADHMSAAMEITGLNAATQFGVGRARQMIYASHGDPKVLLRETSDFCHYLVRTQPNKYGKVSHGWDVREARVAAFMSVNGIDMGAQISPADLQAVEDTNDGVHPNHHHGHTNPNTTSGPSWDNPTSSHTSDEATINTSTTQGMLGPVPDPVIVPEGSLHNWLWIALGLVGGALAMTAAMSWKRHKPEILQRMAAAAHALTSKVDKKVDRMTAMNEPSFSAERGAPRPKSTAQHASRRAGLNEAENQALKDVFAEQNPISLNDETVWRVNYPDNSNVIVQNRLVNIKGDGGLEDSLRYAAQAWGLNCKLASGTEAEAKKIAETAQKMVDEHTLPPGFTIEGIGTFVPRSAPRQSVMQDAVLKAA